MKLKLNGLMVECIIGDLPEERISPQKLRVDASLEVVEDAMVTDELVDTVDYADLSERIGKALIDSKCKMLERAAKIVSNVCLMDDKVLGVEVKVTKFGAIPGLESASVVVEIEK